ncbi:MAG: SCO family protein [Actinomycetota bacterium]
MTKPIPSRHRRARARGKVVLAMAVALGLLLAACGDSEPETQAFAGFERTPTPVVDEHELPAIEADGSETPFSFRAATGELLLVYFGYTSCPDVCPTTLSDLARASGRLDDRAERIDVAMITIDPQVDTPEILTGYVRSFVPDATAIRTVDDAELRPVADLFGADYGTIEQNGEETVFHTGSLYAVDDAGQLVLTWPFGVSTEDLEQDLSRLLDEIA